MNKQQLLADIAELLAAKETSFPKEALVKELTTIKNATAQAISLLQNGKRKYKKHAIRRAGRISKYKPLIDNCVAYVHKSNGCNMRTLKQMFSLSDSQRACVYEKFSRDARVVVTKDANGEMFYKPGVL